jgi:hypothetical protein
MGDVVNAKHGDEASPCLPSPAGRFKRVADLYPPRSCLSRSIRSNTAAFLIFVRACWHIWEGKRAREGLESLSIGRT